MGLLSRRPFGATVDQEEVPRGYRGGRPALGSALTDRRTDVALGNQNKVKYMATQLLAKFEENAPAQSSGLRRQVSTSCTWPSPQEGGLFSVKGDEGSWLSLVSACPCSAMVDELSEFLGPCAPPPSRVSGGSQQRDFKHVPLCSRSHCKRSSCPESHPCSVALPSGPSAEHAGSHSQAVLHMRVLGCFSKDLGRSPTICSQRCLRCVLSLPAPPLGPTCWLLIPWTRHRGDRHPG